MAKSLISLSGGDIIERKEKKRKEMIKEPYFTLESIQQQALGMLGRVKDFKRHRSKFKPERSALLILDMQRYFLEESSHAYIPSVKAIIPKIRELLQEYSVRELPVIFTRHLNSKEDAGLMAKWWGDLITEENPLSEITPKLPAVGTVIEKSQYDAFYKTPLEKILRGKSVGQVVICGVMTHLCCETTARSAFVRGFEVFFVVDGTATYNEEFHWATLINLSHGFAFPILVREILTLLKNG
jgi:isochorismate hydrolase